MSVDKNLIVGNVTQDKNGTVISIIVNMKNHQDIARVNYSWNPNICACKCEKNCEIYEYLLNCEGIKSIFDDLLVTCNEIEDMQ